MSSDELESCERLRGMSSEDKEECDHSKALLQEVCSVLCGSPDGRGVWLGSSSVLKDYHNIVNQQSSNIK